MARGATAASARSRAGCRRELTSKPREASTQSAPTWRAKIKLKRVLAALLASLLIQQQLAIQAAPGPSPSGPQTSLMGARPHRKRHLLEQLAGQLEPDAGLEVGGREQPPAASIPANQQRIIQMLPQEEGGRAVGPQRPGQNGSSDGSSSGGNSSARNCSSGLLTFELATGFIYKPAGAADTLAMMPSTLQLTDCLDFCLQNASCLAINFEMGLCVLLATSAAENPHSLYSSQFPVFTIYAEKKCLLADMARTRRRHKCQRAWTFERVAGFEMKLRPRRRLKLASRELCMDACLGELEFDCRSANWYRQTGECHLSDQDRHSVSQSEAGSQHIRATLAHFYGPATAAPASNETARAPAAPPAGEQYQGYRASSLQDTRSQPAGDSASASSASLGSKLASSWTSGKRHFKQMFLGAAAPGRKQQQQQQQQRARQLEPANDWNTASGPATFEGHYIDVPASTHVDYLENNCIHEPNKLCEFRKIQNRVLKTVDSIYQDVGTLEECKQKCLNAPYRCYSFDYGDTSERVCRTSHLDQASLLAINEPYLEVVGAITYELAACFNVSIQCGPKEMRVQVSASKSFNGKIYAKTRPSSCVTDVAEALHFELAMKYHDDDADGAAADGNEDATAGGNATTTTSRGCDVRASSSQLQGVFSNDIVIQHHDRIMTTQDVGLSVFCQYDLGNRSVTNNVELAIEPLGEGPVESKQSGAGAAAGTGTGSHAASAHKSPLTITGLATTVVRSPNVTMRITNMNGQPVTSATVGDRLALLFEVKEKTSPFGIFVREIVALDGRQYLHQLHHHHHHHHANASSSGQQQQQQHEGNSDKPTSPSVLYYGPQSSAAPGNALTTAPPLNDTLIESAYHGDPVNSIQFIDADGCPTDANLMGPLVKMDPHGHRLLAPFDAFKFPTSDMVFFRAVVTSCLAECKPAVCPGYSPTLTTAATAGSATTTPSTLYSSTLAQAGGSNSIGPDEPLDGLKGEPTPGVAQLLTFSGDN